MSPGQRLRESLERGPLIVAPGAYDGITTRLVDQAGFQAIYMTGAGTAAAHGFPDYGLITASEMATNAARMVAATDLPVIADIDTGYGNELNVTRTVRDFERAGVAAMHLEDQVAPKRCGHLEGKDVIPLDAFISKIRAAAEARSDPSLILIARSDARAVIDLDDAIGRVNAALAAGADMAFVEAAQSIEDLATIPARVNGPCVLNVVPGGRTPVVSYEEGQAMGYRLAICPGVLLRAVVAAADDALRQLKANGLPAAPPKNEIPVSEMFRRFGAGEWDEVRARFAEPSL